MEVFHTAKLFLASFLSVFFNSHDKFPFWRSRLTNSSMTSPAKTSGDDSSPRSLDTNGSRFASPSTAPTNYSPAETRGFAPVLESMYERLSVMGIGGNAAASSDDPFTENRSQAAYLSATAAPYQPVVRAPITELNATSTPERMPMHSRRQYSFPALGRTLNEHASFGSPSAAGSFNTPPGTASFNLPPGAASFNLQSSAGSFISQAAINELSNPQPSPRAKQSLAGFTSDPEAADGSAPLSRYICLSNVDAYDVDERNPRSRLAQFRQVRHPNFTHSFTTRLLLRSM